MKMTIPPTYIPKGILQHNRQIIISTLALLLTVWSCTQAPQSDPTASENDTWIYLFDGSTLEGWRAYNSDKLPEQWIIKDGVLTFDIDRIVEEEHEGGQDIIYGLEQFENFELELEWKIPPGGNSGIFYHLQEGYDAPYLTAPEYQLIDDEGYAAMHDLTAYNISIGNTENPSQLQPLQRTAADYGMYAANDSLKVLNPAGEWNSTRILFTPERVEHWLNGKMVVSFVPWSDDWHQRRNNSKWKDVPDYGKYKSGYIGLQDHDSPIWFRNIRIRKLD